LKDLRRPERLYQLDIDGLPTAFGPLRAEGKAGNLPVQLTTFVGRGEEIASIRRLLEHTRLLTLTGSGGTGKTRLAIQAAAEMQNGFPGGAWFVPLASVTDATLVPAAIAD